MKNRNTFKFIFAAALIGGSFAALAMEEQFKKLKIDSDQEELGMQLIEAAYAGNLEEVNRLIKEGANVDYQDESGHTALIRAAANNRLACAQALLNAQADPNILTTYGKRSALMEAALFGRHEIVNLLIKVKAELDIQDRNGRTALMSAATSGPHDNPKCVSLLIAANANINVLDKIGCDALLCAYQWNNIHKMDLLVDAGADLRRIARRHRSWIPELITRSINTFHKRKKEAYALLWCIKQFAQDSICDKDLGLLIAEPLLAAFLNHKEMLSEAIELLENEHDKIALRAALNAEPDNNQSN